jgi:hypothetical protein
MGSLIFRSRPPAPGCAPHRYQYGRRAYPNSGARIIVPPPSAGATRSAGISELGFFGERARCLRNAPRTSGMPDASYFFENDPLMASIRRTVP